MNTAIRSTSTGLESITLQRMPSGAWRGIGTGTVGVVGRFVDGHDSPGAALAAVLVAPPLASTAGRINVPPSRVTFPKPPSAPVVPRQPTVYKPLRSRIWTKQPPGMTLVPPVVVTPPSLPPITPITRMSAEFPTVVREYVNRMASIVDAYNAGGARRAALATADLLALLEWLQGQEHVQVEESQADAERRLDEAEAAQQ